MHPSRGHDEEAETAVFWDEIWTLDDEWHPKSSSATAVSTEADRPGRAPGGARRAVIVS